jgi:hypothetical protein
MITPQDTDKQNRITTLCNRCRSNYERAGYHLTFTGNYIKETCDFCGCAFGYDYKLEDRRNANKTLR